MEDFEALAASGAEWERRLAEYTPQRAGEPSILPGWSAHDLINHVVGGALRYLLLLRGAALDIVEATRGHDHIGADPLRVHRSYAGPLGAEFRAPDVLQRTVKHRAGQFSGLELLRMRVLEQTLHSWDLARTLGTDDTLPAELVAYLLANCEDLVLGLREAGRYDGPVGADGNPADPQYRLLVLTGRDRHL